MADVKKSVEIALNIIGADTTAIQKVLTAFENAATSIDKATASINSFQNVLNGIKVPPAFNSVITSLKELNGIKVPNLLNIATGFEKLGAITKVPNLQPFADQMLKLQGITLPNLGQIGTGFKTIVDTPIEQFAPKIAILVTNLKSLQGITLPNLGQIGTGLKAIQDTKLSGFNLKITTLSTALQNLNGITLPNLGQIGTGLKAIISTPLSGFALKIGTLETNLRRLEGITLPNLGQIGAGLKKIMSTPMTGFASQITLLETGLNRLAAINLDALATVLSNLAKTNLGKAGLQLQKVEEGLRNAGTAAESAGIKIGSFSDKLRTVLQFRVISGVIQQFHQSMMEGVTAIIEYDQALKDLQAITGATSIEVAQMGLKILEVATSTKFSASEIADGMRIIGQAGFSASEAIQTMQAVSNLATGTLSAMATTVDLVTTAMRVFTVDASQSSQLADVFANAVNKSKLTIDDLNTAMNYVGPVAKDAGISINELASAMGILSNAGLRPSTIGTSLRNIIAQLVSPSKALKQAVKDAGISLNELDPTVNSFSSILSDLRLVISDTGLAFDIFGKRGASAALALTTAGSDFNGMLDTIGKSGTAAKMAAIQMEGLGISFKNLRDRIGVLSIAIGEGGITTAMRLFIDVAKGIITIFTAIASSAFGKFVISSGLVTTAIYAIATAFTFLGTKVKAVADIQIAFLLIKSGAVTATQAVVALATTFLPFLKIIAILTSVAIAIDLIKGHTKELMLEASKSADSYGALVDAVYNYQMSLIGLESGSTELKNANLALRDSLLDTKNKFVELSNEAYAVIASINPVTGVMEKGSIALDTYSKKVNDLQMSRLVDSSNLANKSIQEQTSWLSRLGNKFADLGQIISMNGSELKAFTDRQKEVNDFSKLLSEGFDKSGISFKDLGDTIAGWDTTNLTAQQKEIIKGYELIDEQTTKYIEKLIKTNQIGLDDTVENMKQVAVGSGITGVALTSLVEKFTLLKAIAAEGFSNRIEKWEQEAKATKNADGTLKDYIATYLKIVGGVSKEDQIEASRIRNDQANFVRKLNNAKKLKEVEIANGVSIADAANKYYATERKLQEESTKTSREASESKLIQNSNTLAKLSSDLDNKLAQDALKYKGNLDLIEKYRSEALLKFNASVENLRMGFIDPKELNNNAKESSDILKAGYDRQRQDLEISLQNKKITEDEYNKQIRALNVVEAQEIIKIWADANAQILLQKSGESSDASSIRDAQRQAEVVEGQVRIEAVKAIEQKIGEIQTSEYLKYTQKREALLSQYLQKITSLEYNGVLTHNQASIQKTQAEISMYQDMLSSAKEYLSQVEESQNSDEYEKRHSKVVEAEEKLNNIKIKSLEEYNTAKEEHSKNLLKIEEDLSADLEKINEDLIEKIKKINESQSDQKKKSLQTIVSIEQDAADKISSIKQKGMSEEEKNVDNSLQMQKKLADGQKLVYEGASEGDKSKLELGVQLLKQSQELASGLDNERNAIDGIEKATKALQDAERQSSSLEVKESEKKLLEEIRDSKEKEIKLIAKAEKAKQDENKKLTDAKDLTDSVISAIEKASKTPLVVSVDGMTKVTAMKKEIEAIKNKTVTVTVKVNKVETKSSGGLAGAYANGGTVEDAIVSKFADGGNVFKRLLSPFINRGGGQKDDVPAMLMKGEFVLKKSAVAKYGKKFLYMLNQGVLNRPSGFRDGGIVHNFTNAISDKVDNGIRSVQLGLNPKAPFKQGGVTYNINAPSFYKNIDKKASQISSVNGKKRALSLTKMFSNIVPLLQSGGGTDVLSQFDQEKMMTIQTYDNDIQYAKDSGDNETASLLEAEKVQIQILAQDLAATLEAIRLDYEVELLQAKQEMEDDVASFAKDSTDAKLDYKKALSDLNYERSEIEQAFTKEKKELQSQIGPNWSSNDPAGKRIKEKISLSTKDYHRDMDNLTSKLQESNSELNRDIESAKEKTQKSEERFASTETVIKKKEANDITSETNKIEYEKVKLHTDTTNQVSKVSKDTAHEVARLNIELQKELLELRKTYDALLKQESSTSSNTPSFSGVENVSVTHWLNKGGFVGYPKGKRRKKDDIAAMLTPGEYVLKEEAVQHYGMNFLDSLNKKEIDPSYDKFPSSFSPTMMNGVIYHVNAPSFHDNLAGKDFKTAEGVSSAKRMTAIFSDAVPHLANGGDLGTAQQQMTAELVSSTEEFDALIKSARDSGDSELAFILETEKMDIQFLNEELQYTLTELADEYTQTLSDLEYEYNLQMQELEQNKANALAEVEQELAELNTVSVDTSGKPTTSAKVAAKNEYNDFIDTYKKRKNLSKEEQSAASGYLKAQVTGNAFGQSIFWTETSKYKQEKDKLKAAYMDANHEYDADNNAYKIKILNEIQQIALSKQDAKFKKSNIESEYSYGVVNADTEYESNKEKAERIYDYETYKTQKQADFAIRKVQVESAQNYREAKLSMEKELKSLEIEMARSLYEIKKTYGEAQGDFGVQHWLNDGGIVGMKQGSIRGVDSVRAMLTPGEFVIKESVVNKFGRGFFNRLNNFQLPKYFADGGIVEGNSPTTPINNGANEINSFLGTVNLQVGKNTYPVQTNLKMAKQLISEFKRMGLSIA